MVMPLSGTFAYSTTVPVDGLNAFPWAMKSPKPFERSGDELVDKRLVGWSPLFYIREAGAPPDSGRSSPEGGLSEIRLVATDKKYASLKMVSYFLDPALIRVLRPGDIFNITRTGCGGIGVSTIRQGKLIFAVGEVTAVPLGSDISVEIPYELLSKAEAILRQRDPSFEFLYHPVEVCISESRKIWYRGLAQMGGYHVWVEHGFMQGMPGTPESVSITLDEACDWMAGRESAQLLASP